MAIDSKYQQEFCRRLEQVKHNIAVAAGKSGRQPEDITIIGVSKFFPAEIARIAIQCGLGDLGENRVQEFLAKADFLAHDDISPRWHLIGTLQTNKIRYILGRTCLIHSVDRPRLLAELAAQSREKGLVTDILLQINISGEASKHGFAPEQTMAAVEQAVSLAGVRLRGLMTMAPLVEDPQTLRPLFAETGNLFARIREELAPGNYFSILSMGMTQDYIQAIECGATHVRLGTALFGPRL